MYMHIMAAWSLEGKAKSTELSGNQASGKINQHAMVLKKIMWLKIYIFFNQKQVVVRRVSEVLREAMPIKIKVEKVALDRESLQTMM